MLDVCPFFMPKLAEYSTFYQKLVWAFNNDEEDTNDLDESVSHAAMLEGRLTLTAACFTTWCFMTLCMSGYVTCTALQNEFVICCRLFCCACLPLVYIMLIQIGLEILMAREHAPRLISWIAFLSWATAGQKVCNMPWKDM